MEIVICGAPLDSSFQKDKLELVNKGSLGRRRKPTRANLKNILSPSKQVQKAPNAPEPLVECRTKHKVNGHIQSERNVQTLRPTQKTESSLPRTSLQPNHVADAHQFSIEAKLKRKKSNVGRSAVLIQTWERRTWNNSLTRQKETDPKDVRLSTCNRFQNKENLRNHTMPEPKACGRHLLKRESPNSGGLVSKVRDCHSADTMLYRVAESRPRPIKQLNMNGRKPSISGQEPEWISLSKKLCAKFVEGYIEPNSTDSYLQEEPDGVKKPQPPQQVSQHRPHHQTISQQQQTISKRVEKTVKTVEMKPTPATSKSNANQPPWIDLSRKLCTKFIEEHIEYPVVACEEPLKKTLAVEPNGDVRIIEKVGKPKGRKSKTRKDSEPEWISLSRKLRAKFIESHIDDPDTISMENQLNASDPELSSESLSDNYQEAIIPRKANTTTTSIENKRIPFINIEKVETAQSHPNHFQINNRNYAVSPERECCWEYQEMEFDQESNSGTFDAGFSEDSITNCEENKKPECFRNGNTSAIRGNIRKQTTTDENSKTFTSFAETANAQKFSHAECYNNDVRFAPHVTNTEKSTRNSVVPEKKINIKFVEKSRSPNKNTQGNSPDRNNGHCAFFNLTTWEEAHCKPEDTCSASRLQKDLRSMSMDNLSNSDKGHHKKSNEKRNSNNNISNLDCHLSPKNKTIFKSEDILDKLECKISTRNGVSLQNRDKNHEVSREDKYQNGYGQSGGHFIDLEGSEKDFSVNGCDVRDIESEGFESFEINPEYSEENTEALSSTRCESHLSDTSGNSETINSKMPVKKTSKNDREDQRRREDFEEARSNVFRNSPEYQATGNFLEDFDSIENISTSNISIHPKSNKSDDSEITESEASNGLAENKKLIRIPDGNVFDIDSPINFSEHNLRGHRFSVSKTNEDVIKNAVNGESNGVSSEKSQNNIDSRKLIEKGTGSSQNQQRYDTRPSSTTNNNCSMGLGNNARDFEMGMDSKQNPQSTNDQKPTGMKKHFKCNGVIPKTKETQSNSCTKISNGVIEKKITNDSDGLKSSKDNAIKNAESERICVNEYANISSTIAERNLHMNDPRTKVVRKSTSVNNVYNEMSDYENRGDEEFNSKRNISVQSYNGHSGEKDEIDNVSSSNENFTPPSSSLKIKSRSMYDISSKNEHSDCTPSKRNEIKSNGHEIACTKYISPMTFQEFSSASDIPLCAKLVSKQNGKPPARSVSSSSNRNPSPCSEASHVYEDMLKETPSCPSDSETASWTVMKNNSYYVNGRSSSMNDLDLSDSCSMSVKCDYASSGSEHSTLQSRHSSVTSSSFYVNLRDYDSHMLEPSLNRKKKDSKKSPSSRKCSKSTNSNPPTPESLRHLFTSPFQTPANRNPRLLSRMPPEPEPHYYSTAAATSSAFKHGFDSAPPKQKKTERSSSVKIKDIAHGIILTFRRLQNHSKSSSISPNHYVDVSHLAESNHAEMGKRKSKKEQKEILKKQQEDKKRWRFSSENIKTDSDSGCHLTPSDIHSSKARRTSSDLTGNRPKFDIINTDMTKSQNGNQDKKKTKAGKKASNAREKGKKARSKSIEPRPISTVSRKVQQMPDGTLYLVTTVSGDTALPGVYSDSPDSSSELSTHRPVKLTGESNC